MNDIIDDYIEHHGIKGMKWGVWNAETAARYAGVVGRKLKTAVKKGVDNKKAEFAENRQKKKEQKAFDKETQKKYHLSAKEYEKLRETTLRSNDPSVVSRGMHLLSDEELNAKLDRLKREEVITTMALKQKKQEASIRKELAEAKQKTLGYQIGDKASTAAIDLLKNSVIKPGLDQTWKDIADERNRVKKEQNEKREKQKAELALKLEESKKKTEEKKKENEAKKQAKKEEKEQNKKEWKEADQRDKERARKERQTEAHKSTERVMEILREKEKEANRSAGYDPDIIDVDPVDQSNKQDRKKR